MIARIASALTLAALVGFATPALSQTTVIDEGTFRLSVRGAPVGTESFTIRQTGAGAGATVVAQGRVALDTGEQIRALLQADGPGLRPSAYQIEVTGPDRQTIRGQAAGNRFRAQIVSSGGETMREYLVSEGAVVIDDGVAHQHYFLASRIGDDAVPIIIPRQSRQVAASVRETGRESVDVGGQSVAARRLAVQPEGMAARTVWLDDQGRVLRLSIPDNGFLAERTAPPQQP